MAVKELLTRIALKYDTYENWMDAEKGGKLVLLKGEIGICEVPTSATGADKATNAPTILFKVGDGEKTFSQLNWVSAKAADVYEWAKAETVVLDGEVLKFKTGDDVKHSVDLSSFALDTAVQEVVADLSGAKDRISDIEAALGLEDSGNGNSVSAQIATIEGKLEVIQGNDITEGSINKALKDAKAYTDTREAEIKLYADQAEADAITSANTYTDGKVTAQAAVDSAQDAKIQANTDNLAQELIDRAAADEAINKKFGADYSEENSVADAIAVAKKEGTDAKTAVNTLETGKVATNTTNIGLNTAAIAQEKADREAADTALDTRVKKVEAFFEGATEDSDGLNNALDKLVDIQEYLSGEGTATDGLLGTINDHENRIDVIEAKLDDTNGTLTKRVAQAEADIDAMESRAEALETLTGEGGIIRADIKAAKEQADKGVADAKTAQEAANAAKSAADDAQGAVDDLADVINDEENGLAAVKTIADQNAADIAKLKTDVETAQGDITNLKNVVTDGDNSNEKLRTDITALETLTGDALKGNEQLRTDLDTVTNKVNDEDTGLEATKTIADEAKTQASTNAGKISAIEADYLKEADFFIINCGSASEVTHVKTTA